MPSTSTASASLPSAVPGAWPFDPRPSGRLNVPVMRTSPVAVTGAPDDCALMREEIFGPILPIVPYNNLQEALKAMAELQAAYARMGSRQVMGKLLLVNA